MRRRLFTILSALSLMLALALAALWVRSYWIIDNLRLAAGPDTTYVVATRPGHLLFTRVQTPVGRSHGTGYDRIPVTGDVSPFTQEGSGGVLRSLGFDHLAWSLNGAFGTYLFRRLVFPLYLPLLLSLLLPYARYRRRSRPGPGLCPSCGYDLRATPERCPECGYVPEPAEAKSSRSDAALRER